jgi:YHS domain-containing protein
MGFIGRFVKFLFWVLILSWAVKLIARMLRGANRGEPAPGRDRTRDGERGKRLVRDPVCGMHMAEELALALSAGGGTQYFCSEECRQKYESGFLRRAANG